VRSADIPEGEVLAGPTGIKTKLFSSNGGPPSTTTPSTGITLQGFPYRDNYPCEVIPVKYSLVIFRTLRFCACTRPCGRGRRRRGACKNPISSQRYVRDAETSEPEMPRSGFLYLFAGFTSAVLTYIPPSVGITAFLTFLPSIIAVSLYTAFRKTCTRQPSDGRFCACYTGTSPASAEFTMLALLAPVGLSIFMTRLAVAAGSPPPSTAR